jgi:hypothetical protein
MSLSAPWPVGIPSGVSFYFQTWQQDPSAYFDWIGTNGLRALTP